MKPNVLQLIGSFNQGGSERQAVQLSRLLHKSGRFRVHVACLDGGGPLRAEIEGLGLGPIAEFPLTSFYDRNMIAQLRLFGRYLRESKIDVLHTHDFYTNIFGMAGATISHLPLVRIASRRETGGLRTRSQEFVQRHAFGRAHAIVVNADAVRAELVAEGVNPKKAKTIYNGLDLTRFNLSVELNRAKVLPLLGLGNAMNRRLVTIVANMRHAVKDQRTFLQAASQVHSEVEDSAFVLAGEGELLESLRAYAAELGLADDTYFIGPCDRIAELLAVSEVCVLSSTHEGFSNSIIEYMAASRPVVATDVGGAREAIVNGETGHIVPPGDAREMAMRIVALLRDQSHATEMGRLGRHVVEERFSCETQLVHTEELYEQLLASRQSVDVSRTRGASRDQNAPVNNRP